MHRDSASGQLCRLEYRRVCLERPMPPLPAHTPVVRAHECLELFECRIPECFRRDDRIYRTRGLCTLRILRFTARDPLNSGRSADQTWQAHRAAKTRKYPERNFRQTHMSTCRHYPDIRRERHLQSTAECQTVDRGDTGDVQVIKRGKHCVLPRDVFFDLRLRLCKERREFEYVGAHNERLLGARDQHASHPVRGADERRRGLQLINGADIKLVYRLAAPIETQLCDPIGAAYDAQTSSFKHNEPSWIADCPPVPAGGPDRITCFCELVWRIFCQ